MLFGYAVIVVLGLCSGCGLWLAVLGICLCLVVGRYGLVVVLFNVLVLIC